MYVSGCVVVMAAFSLKTKQLLFKTYNNLQNECFFGTFRACKTKRNVVRLPINNFTWRRPSKQPVVIVERCLSSTVWCRRPVDGQDSRSLTSYELMNFPQIIWPNVIHMVKNWILASIIIRPFLDREFTISDFVHGAKQAVLHVSALLSKGKLSALTGLVTDEALSEIERNYPKLSSSQRRELLVIPDDVYFLFPYQIGIMLEDTGGVQKRLVEITICFHCLLGSSDIRRNDPSFSNLSKYKERILIGNYRFIKEFTKGKESDWTINVINYFKPDRVF